MARSRGMSSDGYSEEQHFSFGDGVCRIVSPDDPEFPEGAWWDALNMVYDGEADNPESMPGVTRLGTTDMGGAVSGLFDYNNGDKLIATATNGTIYEYNGTDWVAASGARATGNSSAAGTRWSGTMFYGATTAKNLLILCNGIDAPVRYDTVNGCVTLGGSPSSTGNFPVAHRGRCWMASGSTVFYSATNDAEDWTTGGGGGNVLCERGFDGNLTGMASFMGSLIMFKRSSTYRFPPTATISELNLQPITKSVGAIAHQTIQEVRTDSGSYLSVFSERGIEGLYPTNTSGGFDYRNLSRWIQPILLRQNRTNMARAFALWNWERRELYVFYPTGSATNPSEGVIGNFARERRPPRWTRTDFQDLTAGVIFNDSNVNYYQYVGDSNGRVYRMNILTSDQRIGAAYAARLYSKVYTQRRPNWMKEFGWTFVSAESSGKPVVVKQVIMRKGLPTYTSNQGDLTVDQDSAWGSGQWGVALWGGSGNTGDRIRPGNVARGSGLRVMIESQGWYKLSGIIIASALCSDSIAA